MVLDHRGHYLDGFRSATTLVIRPVYAVAGLPGEVIEAVSDFFTTSRTLRGEVTVLKDENRELKARTLRYEAVQAENERLRQRLDSAVRVSTRHMAANLIEVAGEPGARKIVVARGSRQGIYVGQPAIDAHGVLGQVTQVAADVSRITLITDPGHAIPALVNRSGLRVLVFGTGDQNTLKVAHDMLKVPYLTASADIKPGDLLVTSGMGGTFPPGYPVGVVVKIVHNPNEAFLDVHVRPAARLSHGTQAILIWPTRAPLKAPGPPVTKPAKP
ncbi:MAG: rod shape-determining protein MreC [Candidatus Muproteobacteria bacterium RBG_16_64_10]|uniref:Cell shape-determining protein MreC n=1 Tax=Candidatus Muproteobacteria bacterium RBG_16_64_10 TaxID=1817757 RepID=A0A1F6T1M1_9PROT|nr:MAG: rod shape-determining protein MreC [Candidatus Muproteobacteria bacterium RBG_16_64_10]